MSDPLFSGTVRFVQPAFVTPGGTFTFSDADMQTMVQYAQHAIVPVLEMVNQEYGPSATVISPATIPYTANMSAATFSDSELQGWVNDILSNNQFDAATTLIVVPCPSGIADDAGMVGANGGYHSLANGPYAVFGVYSTGLTLADQVDQYAMVVSHEIAEAVVDPTVDHVNPEVCDPCCENCYHGNNFYRVYFDAFNNYLGTNQQTPPGGFNFAYYTAVVVKPAGASDCPAPDADCDYAPVIQNFYFVAEKNNFGHDEVSDTLTWPDAFYLFLEGYSPAGIAASLPGLTGSFNSGNIPGLTITHSSTSYDAGNTGDNANLPQRIRFGYDIAFTAASLPAFPASGNPPKSFQLDATIAMQGQPLPFAPKLEFFLLAGADPYFTNLRDGTGDFYLSQDLRVFTGTPAINPTPVGGPGAPQLTDSYYGAYEYISNLIAYLNQQIGYLNPGYTPPDTNSFDPLDTLLPDQNGLLTADSTVTPKTGSANNYNFAIARVRLKGASGLAGQAANVKVFFRLFTTQTFDTDFVDSAAVLSSADPNITYPSDGGSDPTFPLPGTDGGGTINGCSLPFFATGNYADGPVDYTPGGVNNQTITIPGNEDYAWAFFGCFLNVYDLSNVVGGGTIQHWTAGSAHNCLVAQIAYSGAPILNANGVIENPENSDKLAQRNLQVTPSGNPGFPATHRVPQTLDVRPSQAVTVPVNPQGIPSLLSYPDEIMIDWGEVPAGSVASLYWPDVNAAEVLALAAALYPGHGLASLDPHTLQCQISARVAYIPIPAGTGGSFAGLFTLSLPASVHVGSEYDITVRRISSRRQRVEQPPQIQAAHVEAAHVEAAHVEASAGAPAASAALEWRYISGTFHMKVPVQRDGEILPVDENLLSILEWRLTAIGPGSRWYPVLLRYIDVLKQRIIGFGGDPAQIPPSPSGYQQPAHHRPGPVEHCYTGKVTSLFFDRFGDFEGFDLRTDKGEEHSFRAFENEIEELIYLAWVERFVITVCARDGEDHLVVAVILRRAPR
jgi:hypothetical protein